jgi:hypothetical protein
VRFALIVAVVAVLGLAASASARFTPRTLAGTWSGTWTKQTFGSSGPATVVAKSLAGNTKLLFSVDFEGEVFGCPSVPPEATPPLAKGTAPNHWSAAGFHAEREVEGLRHADAHVQGGERQSQR